MNDAKYITTVLETSDEWGFSSEKTFNCGQSFLFRNEGDGTYSGVVAGKWARVDDRAGGGVVMLTCGERDVDFWRHYLSIDETLDRLFKLAELCPAASASVECGRGIRLLHQDPWETLCTFIVSQCNNIPRITGILAKFCDNFGEPITTGNGNMRAFPLPERIAPLNEGDLAVLRAGYRAPYLIGAARAVCTGELDLAVLKKEDIADARTKLMRLRGIGKKVADCVLLFGLEHGDAFPVDVWMKRALTVMPDGFDPSVLGQDAGYFQQCLFFAAREGVIGPF